MRGYDKNKQSLYLKYQDEWLGNVTKASSK